VQPFAVAAARHGAPGELVHDDHFALRVDDVVLFAVVKLAGADRLGDHVRLVHVLGAVEVFERQQPLDLGDALLGQVHRLALFLDGVVAGRLGAHAGFGGFTFLQAANELGEHVVQVGRFFGGPRDDQRGAGLVDQDRVHLVHDGVVQRRVGAQHQRFFRLRHVVAQVIEAEFGVGDVGDVAGVSGLLFGGREFAVGEPHRQPERAVEQAHFFHAHAGEVVVDRDEVAAFAFQRVEGERQRRHQRFAFAGAHFGDAALVQRGPADELGVVVAFADGAAPRLADQGKSGHDQAVEGLAPVLHAAAQVHKGFGEVLNAHRLFFKRIDRFHHRLDDAFDIAFVIVEHFVQDTKHDLISIARPHDIRLNDFSRAGARGLSGGGSRSRDVAGGQFRCAGG